MTNKKSKNPVGRPRKKHGKETLLDKRTSFKLDNNNVVFDKYTDALILMFAVVLVACIVLLIFLNK